MMIDTAHLEFPASYKPFTISAATLARWAMSCHYPLMGEKILFGIRGATLLHSDTKTEVDKNVPEEGIRFQENEGEAYGVWGNRFTLREVVPDGEHFCCLLGVWDRKKGKIALFPASTVPHKMWQQKQIENPEKQIANLLGPGAYRYIVGAHEPEGEGRAFEEGAFRLSRLQPVVAWRFYEANHQFSADKATATLSVVNDHIHSAQSTSRPTGISFSSAGCQVIEGDHLPPNAPTGFYQRFRQFAGQSFMPSEFEIGFPYQYLLTSSRHLEAITQGIEPLRLLQGSRGMLVRSLQEALMARGFLDENLIDKGDFNGATAFALYRYQQAENLRADGIATENLLKRLGISSFGSIMDSIR